MDAFVPTPAETIPRHPNRIVKSRNFRMSFGVLMRIMTCSFLRLRLNRRGRSSAAVGEKPVSLWATNVGRGRNDTKSRAAYVLVI